MADGVDGHVDAAPGRGALDRGPGSSSKRCIARAPNDSAARSRSATESIAITPAALAARATWIVHRLTGLSPSTATTSPGLRGKAGLGDRVVARTHHVAREQRTVGHSSGTRAQRQVGMRHQHELGLRPPERAERLAVPEDATVVALVVLPAAAEEAVAARRAVAAEHAGRRRPPPRPRSRGGHGPHELVAEREARLDGHAPVIDVEARRTRRWPPRAPRRRRGRAVRPGRSSSRTSPGA